MLTLHIVATDVFELLGRRVLVRHELVERLPHVLLEP